jgi:hypothetical protein
MKEKKNEDTAIFSGMGERRKTSGKILPHGRPSYRKGEESLNHPGIRRKIMKGINEIDKTAQIGTLSKSSQDNAGKVGDGDLFKKTFDKILSESADNSQKSEVSTMAGLGEIRSYGLMIDGPGPGSIEKNTDQLLSLLEQYAKDLGDPNKSLKDIEPLVKGIKEEADILSETVKNDTESGKALKSIAENSAVLANVEYTKFMRGDYN